MSNNSNRGTINKFCGKNKLLIHLQRQKLFHLFKSNLPPIAFDGKFTKKFNRVEELVAYSAAIVACFYLALRDY